MAFARVALAVPLRRLFDYKIQPDTQPQIGCRVLVPFGRNKVVGIVIDLTETSDFDNNKIKPIIEVLDRQALFSAELMKMKHWMVNYYLCPPGEVFVNLLPKRLKEGKPAKLLAETIWQTVEHAEPVPTKAKQQFAMHQFLSQNGPTSESLLKQDGFSKQIINFLEKRGAIEPAEIDYSERKPVKITTPEVSLTEEQNIAIKEFRAVQGFATFLLEGVTGSGKTEVYMRLMADVLQNGQQVLILVPEIGLTPQTLQRFQARFNCEIVALHSELNDSERHNAWLKSQMGVARVIVGTRSAVMVPAPDLGLIILDEEHDASYKQLDGLRYNARDVAVKRAADNKCKVILGSATPALETVLNAKQNKYKHLKLTQRATATKVPKIEVLDIKHQPLKAGLCYGTIEAIKHHLSNNNQVLVFLNRRGYSPALICHECGWVCKCERCDNHFTFHKALRQIVCHHCGEAAPPPHQCHDCGSTQIVDVGIGTEQVFDWLNETFPEANAIRIDRDSVRRKGELENKLAAVAEGKHQLLVGTQMLAKGHHFPNLTLTVVVNLDSALYSADYRAAERMAQLLVQVAGRAGRSEKAGQVILQTHFPDHSYIQTLITQGYQKLQTKLLEERNQMMLPPYQYWTIIRLEAQMLEKVQQASQQIEHLFNQHIVKHYTNVELFAAMPAPQEKRAGRFRYLLVFQSDKRSMLNAAISQLVISLEQNQFSQQVRWTVDIDPQEFN